MRAVICFLAMLTMTQPAFACAMDGMYGAHRFSPFQGMQLGMGVDLTNQSSDYANNDNASSYRDDDADEPDMQQDSAEIDPDEPDEERDIAKLDPDDLPRH